MYTTMKNSSHFSHERKMPPLHFIDSFNSFASSRVNLDLLHYLAEIEASLLCQSTQRIAPEKQRSIVSNIETIF